MNRLFFYFRYAFRSIRRGGRWTTLAIFAIAAGVATVVALRGLGLTIGDTLVNNARTDNKGDIRLEFRDGGGAFALAVGGEETESFTPQQLDTARTIVEERGGDFTAYVTGGALQIAKVNGESGGFGTLQLVNTYLIDPQTYPPSHEIEVIDPADATLPDLFTDDRSIVISENLAQQQELELGSQLRVARSDEPFTVTGIVATEAEAGIANIFSAFFGFAYLDLESVQRVIDPELAPNNIAIAMPEPLSEIEAESLVQTIRSEAGMSRRDVDADLAAERLEDRQEIAQALSDFIVVLGLGALLIGGVGIMNTMLVLVRRRTTEIAAMKTFGMKARDVGMLFFAEGILLGLAGSALGCVIGVAMTGIVNQFGEQFLQQPLAWQIHPEALLYGFSLGMVITAIFGLAPILTALQVRPGIILRPNETHTPSLGILQTIGLMLVVTVLIGLIVGQIISPTLALSSTFAVSDPYLYGVLGVAATLAFLGVLTGILWVIIWLVGKLPSFGNVEIKLALRNLSENRLRTSVTLLALSAGMFALSSITFVGEGTRQLLNLQLSRSFGGNVLAFPLVPGSLNQTLNTLVENRLTTALNDVEGVDGQTRIQFYQSEIVSIDGEQVNLGVSQDDRDSDGDFDEPPDENTDEELGAAPFVWGSFSMWDSENPQIYEQVTDMAAGRNLTPEDRGQRVLIGPADSAPTLGIDVGSTITYRVNNQQYTFEVVGFTESNNLGLGTNVFIPPETLGNALPVFQLFSYEVAEENVSEAVVELSSIQLPRVFALDVSFIDSLISRLITQFAAIPTVVGLLSLFAAAVIMANTVALSTLERRKQIGILKSLGLKSWQVLRVMLIESTVIGLLSAILGIGLSVVFVTIATSQLGATIPFPRDARLAGLGLLVAAVVIGWVATFLSANVAVRERVMNVLRYE